MGTYPSDVPERLQLYEKIRYERAHVIQEYSRQAGRDLIDGKPQIDGELAIPKPARWPRLSRERSNHD
jgi:hypothetical protein